MPEEKSTHSSQEEPRERFRRLMDEADSVELEAALAKRKEESEQREESEKRLNCSCVSQVETPAENPIRRMGGVIEIVVGD